MTPQRLASALSIAILLVMAGCRGGGSSTSGTDGAQGNSLPSISGSPPSAAVADANFSFVPEASDADGDSLVFSVENLPGWAAFDAATGEISGTPGIADTGIYPAITISVSDGSASATLPPFDIAVEQAGLYSATLSWLPPTSSADGSPLLDLAGYQIAFGTQPGDYRNTVSVSNPSVTRFVVGNLAAGIYYFVVSAVDQYGNLSESSNEVVARIG